MEPTYEYGFHLAWDCVLHNTRKAYANMRTEIVDALSGPPAETRKRILEALNGFQAQVDWGFDLD